MTQLTITDKLRNLRSSDLQMIGLGFFAIHCICRQIDTKALNSHPAEMIHRRPGPLFLPPQPPWWGAHSRLRGHI